jgi:uncharacterized protein
MNMDIDIQPNAQGQVVLGVLSDTHGTLSTQAVRALADLDPQLILHAGDICGDDILPRLEILAPVVAVLGNNDWPGEYGPKVCSRADFEICGISITMTHIPSRILAGTARLAICGHTHMPCVEQMGAMTIVNPGSVTRPRSAGGPTIARVVLEHNYIRQIEIIPVANN